MKYINMYYILTGDIAVMAHSELDHIVAAFGILLSIFVEFSMFKRLFNPCFNGFR